MRRRFIHTGIVVGVEDEERVHEREAEGHTFVRWATMMRGVRMAA